MSTHEPIISTSPLVKKLSSRDIEVIATWLMQKGKKTQIYYRQVVEDFFSYYQGRGIPDITTIQLVIYLKIHEKKKDSTRNKMKFALSSLLTYAAKIGYIPRNPALAMDKIKIPDRTFSKILSREQIAVMIRLEPNPRNKLIIKLLYFSGVRVEELVKLIVASFRRTELGCMIAVIGKGEKYRTVRIPESLYEELQAFWDDNGYSHTDAAFKSREEPYANLNVSQVWRIIKLAAKRAGIKSSPSPHWFRHSCADHSLQAGAPIDVVQKTLGHASISTTGKYLDIAPKESASDYLEELSDI